MPGNNCGRGSITSYNSDLDMYKVHPMKCKQWSCEECRKTLAARWRRKILTGKPDRWLTLTMPGTTSGNTEADWVKMKSAWTRVVAAIREKFGTFEFVMVTEFQHRGAPHIHALFRGRYIPVKWLSACAQKWGLGFVCDIRALKNDAQAAFYITKYVTKAGAEAQRAPAGMHIISASREFFPKDDPDELTIPNEDEAWDFSLDAAPATAFWLTHWKRWRIYRKSSDGSFLIVKAELTDEEVAAKLKQYSEWKKAKKQVAEEAHEYRKQHPEGL